MRLPLNLVLLLMGALACAILFLTYNASDLAFVVPRRFARVLALVLVGSAVAYSSVLFQTLTNNQILTPSIIGFDSLYMLIQTVVVFTLGASALTLTDRNQQFAINVLCMVTFAMLLYRWIFGKEGRNLYVLVLVGIVIGSFFGSLTSFMQMLIAPNDFVVLQDRMFASFNNIKPDLLAISTILILITVAYSLRYANNLDVLSLGRDQAISLGVNYKAVVNRFLIVIAILVSISTALVGPITFFGLLVANLSYQVLKTYKHTYLVPGAGLIAVIALVGGQFVLERVFTFGTSLSVIVNFIGGIYFIYLLLKESQL